MKQEIIDMFEDSLNTEGSVFIAGIEFDRAYILKEMDPIAYDVELSAFADALGYDEDEDDGQPTEHEEWMSFDPDC